MYEFIIDTQRNGKYKLLTQRCKKAKFQNKKFPEIINELNVTIYIPLYVAYAAHEMATTILQAEIYTERN